MWQHCNSLQDAARRMQKLSSSELFEQQLQGDDFMKTVSKMFRAVLGFVLMGAFLTAMAAAQCGLSTKTIKPSAWQPEYGEPYQRMILVDQHDGREASIVGMWHVIFTAQTMNGAPFSGVIDNSVVVWHRDGTEIMNSARPAQDGDFCLGVWTRTGKLKYYLNHIPWQGNDTENAPSGIGNPQGGAQLIEKVTLNPNGNCYSGTFTLDAYDTSGNLTVSFTGVLAATRITTSTSFGELL
jgi:hypothetical protein